VRIQSPYSHDHRPNKKDFLREAHSAPLEQWEKTTTHKAIDAPEEGFPP
jgi:hypothetical protein